MSFGKNLQYLRQLSKNMTQEALAEKLNVSRQTISKWEMDAANPEMDKALEICRIFTGYLTALWIIFSGRRWTSAVMHIQTCG